MLSAGNSKNRLSCKAAIVWEYNKPVSIETIEVDPPGPFEVRVKVVAAGLCHSDYSAVKGYYSYQPLPFVLGHEGAGIVESVGEGVTTVKTGDKVFAMFLPQCQKCENCMTRNCNVCFDIERKEKQVIPSIRTLGYDGNFKFECQGKPLYHFVGSSAFSEYITIAENSCVKVDPQTPLESAVILSCGFSTGYGSSTNAVDIQPGNSVAVWGLGGVGLASVIGCKHKLAGQIVGIDINKDKEEIARKMGCTDFLCLGELDNPVETIIKLTNGGLHFALVCIGNVQAMEMAVLSIRPGGIVVIVGVAPDTSLMNVSPALMLAGRTIKGCLLGNYKIHEDIPKLVDMYLSGRLPIQDMITKTYKLEEINDALDAMKAGEIIRSVILM